ncbi:Oidioi.mRNA.OKI2018_I69.PAR.g11977.t1.cds [Oikopleura dioica]|uniref:Oidioi.mRNA.OKI2018_I69.PAR.g11977.t1.cds n=1 Tax=Oikopleura dioica TaxID=34765 RepID=A0ABN7S4E2_OIKDI|nr:Oidioi.mRNA.OKI2018_I69.PAR.g11977.t1.cds [Oikopleura dioica]
MDMERPVYLPLLLFQVGIGLVHVIFFIWFWYTHIYKKNTEKKVLGESLGAVPPKKSSKLGQKEAEKSRTSKEDVRIKIDTDSEELSGIPPAPSAAQIRQRILKKQAKKMRRAMREARKRAKYEKLKEAQDQYGTFSDT